MVVRPVCVYLVHSPIYLPMSSRSSFVRFGMLVALVALSWWGFNRDEQTITVDMIRRAATLQGFEITSAEAELMLPDLEQLRRTYTTLRARPLDNGVAPVLEFNPLPYGYAPPRAQRPSVFEEVTATLPADRNALAFYTVGELGSLLRAGAVSSVELTRFFLDRLRRHDATLHCVVTLTEARALAQAEAADARFAAGTPLGPLDGIPYGAKDLFAVADYPTTWGATPYREQVRDETATVIRKLDEAGAVLVAKLTLGALAWGDVWYADTTRNPWNPAKGSSGSSAGSAAAVAAGLVSFALGTETLGSIVSPATVCGTTGLRPTFGRVSRAGAMALSWSMDKVGPLTRNAADAALVLDAIRGTDPGDAATLEAAFNYEAKRPLSSLRVGYLKAAFDDDYPFKAQDAESLEVLRQLGVELVPIELPEAPPLTFLLSVEGAAAFDELTRSGRDDELVRQERYAWPNVFRQSRFVPAVEYINANRHRRLLIESMHATLEGLDAYVHPSWASTSLGITNLTGHPCVVVPNGFIDGEPTSISFTGQLFGEAAILRLAQAYQSATDFDEQHPNAYLK